MGNRSGIITFVLLAAAAAWAQEPPPDTNIGVLPRVQGETPAAGLIPPTSLKAYPYAYYTPETDLAFGGGGSVTWRYPELGPDQRPNSILAAVTYTTRKQLMISCTPEIFTSDGSWLLKGYIGYKRYPDKFWGVGPDAPDGAEEEFEPLILEFDVRGQHDLGRAFRGGPTVMVMDYRPHELDPDGQLAGGDVLGSEGTLSVGLGLTAVYDTRDLRFSPEAGSLADLQLRFFGTALGSDYTFEQLILDLRNYRPVGRGWVLALQAYSHTTSGEAPFNMLAMLGGSQRLRGYWTGRYRDRKALVLQSELRVPLGGRFGGVVFAGTGAVGHRYVEMGMKDFKPSLGAGLRFLFDEDANLKLRLDAGFGEKGTSGFYATIMEAF